MSGLATAIGVFLTNKKNHVAFLVVAAVFLPFTLMSVIGEIRYALGYEFSSLFCCQEDRFADLLKAAMSYKSITSVLLGSDAAAHWPEIYRQYLVITPSYEGLPLLHYNVPPFGALIHILAAQCIVAAGPTATLWACLLAYCALVVGVTGLLRKFFLIPDMEQLATVLVLLLSYPVLFMLARGNFLAGYTSLCLGIYVLTAIKGQYRWFGLLCLALAINMRPNTAVFGLLELVVDGTMMTRLKYIVGCACLSFCVFYASLMIVRTVDPDFGLSKFREAYGVYALAFIKGSMGFEWNFSLFGATRVLRHMVGIRPSYSEICYVVVQGVGVVAALASIFPAATRRLSLVDAVFLATALSALFTPIFAFYHMTEFAVPLLAVLAVKGEKTKIGDDDRLVFVTSLLCLCPFDARYALYALPILGVMVVIMVRATTGANRQLTSA